MFNCPFPTLLEIFLKQDKDKVYTSVLSKLFINSVAGCRGERGGEIEAITGEHVIVIRMLLKRHNLYWRISPRRRAGGFNQIIRDNEDSVEAVEAGLYSKSDCRTL